VVREPTHELDAVYTALLVKMSAADDLKRAVQELARDWSGRIELQLRGPLAVYDFVGTAVPATGS
jgi:Gas vesicle synthesis protein GvpL/GvpF